MFLSVLVFVSLSSSLTHSLSFPVKLCLSQRCQVNFVKFNFMCTLLLRAWPHTLLYKLFFFFLSNEKKTNKFLIELQEQVAFWRVYILKVVIVWFLRAVHLKIVEGKRFDFSGARNSRTYLLSVL